MSNNEKPADDVENVENGEKEPDVHQEFLNSLIQSRVTIKLNSGLIYRGKNHVTCISLFYPTRKLWSGNFTDSRLTGELQAVDGYMNIALENCTEIRNGQPARNWGDAFIRGNNGTTPNLTCLEFTNV